MCVWCLYVNHDSNHAPYTTALIKLKAHEQTLSHTAYKGLVPSFERCDAILSQVSMAPVLTVARLGEDRYTEARSDECLPESGKRGVYAWFHYGEMLRVPSGGTLARSLIEIQTGAPLPHQSHLNFHIFYFILAKDIFQVCFRRGFRWSARWLFFISL